MGSLYPAPIGSLFRGPGTLYGQAETRTDDQADDQGQEVTPDAMVDR